MYILYRINWGTYLSVLNGVFLKSKNLILNCTGTSEHIHVQATLDKKVEKVGSSHRLFSIGNTISDTSVDFYEHQFK